MSLIVILGIVLAVIVVAGVVMYNGLVRLNQRVEEAWSDITVQLKRRYDLIPNLVSTVKGYAAHEKTVLEEIYERTLKIHYERIYCSKYWKKNIDIESIWVKIEFYSDLSEP